MAEDMGEDMAEDMGEENGRAEQRTCRVTQLARPRETCGTAGDGCKSYRLQYPAEPGNCGRES